jgi:hypothetical protein
MKKILFDHKQEPWEEEYNKAISELYETFTKQCCEILKNDPHYCYIDFKSVHVKVGNDRKLTLCYSYDKERMLNDTR